MRIGAWLVAAGMALTVAGVASTGASAWKEGDIPRRVPLQVSGADVVDLRDSQIRNLRIGSGQAAELAWRGGMRIKRVGEELGARLHERGIKWWDVQLDEYQPLPKWKDFPGVWQETARVRGRTAADFPFWLLTSRSMQYSWGSNVSLPVLADVARHVKGHFGVMLNRGAARRLGIADGDLVEIESPTGRTQGQAILREGVRPDVAVVLQQFGHWATPFARDLGMPNLNQVASMDLALTDATGSGADLVPVAIRPAHAARGDADADDRIRLPIPLGHLRTEDDDAWQPH